MSTDMPNLEAALTGLQSGRLYHFKDWPNGDVPLAAAGVYSIWRGAELVYVGMSGRGLTRAEIERHRAAGNGRGLKTRLASHAAGRRSGDQFCVYVADRLVLPELTSVEVKMIAAGTLSLDAKVREFIHRELTYRFVLVEDAAAAFELEYATKAGALPAGRPLLNPSP